MTRWQKRRKRPASSKASGRHAKDKAEKEKAALEALAQSEGHNEPLAAWDWHHYAEKRRSATFSIDGAELMPYFELNNMIAAVFETANRLFGLSFKEASGVPFTTRMCASSRSRTDREAYRDFSGRLFPPAVQTQRRLDQQLPRPGAARWRSPAHCRQRAELHQGPPGGPSLLSLDDARTLFHEFGHALHGMLSNVTYRSLSGTSVDRDFVELPSQLFENWLLQPETLRPLRAARGNRRANAAGPRQAGDGRAQIQSRFRHGGIYRIRAIRPRYSRASRA